jgi:hypothetical protein
MNIIPIDRVCIFLLLSTLGNFIIIYIRYYFIIIVALLRKALKIIGK